MQCLFLAVHHFPGTTYKPLTRKEDSTLWRCLFPNSPPVNAIFVSDNYQYRNIRHAHLICSNIIPPHSQKWKYCCKVPVTESPDDIQSNVMTAS